MAGNYETLEHITRKLACSKHRALNIACSSLIVIFASLISQAVSANTADSDVNQQWSDWVPMAEGMMARRREPAMLEQPRSQRKLANVQRNERKVQRQIKRLKRKAEATDFDSLESLEVVSLEAELRSLQSRGSGNKLWALEQAQQSEKNNGQGRNRRSLWMYTSDEGVYASAVEDLAETMGRSAKHLRRQLTAGSFALYNDGREVAFYFDAEADEILFVGQSYETFFTDENAYKLVSDSRPSVEMALIESAAATTIGDFAPFTESLVFEEEPDFNYATWSVADEQDADYWWWDFMQQDFRELLPITLSIPNPYSTGTAEVRVTMRGFTDIVDGPDHHVTAELNGTPIGAAVIWDGFDQVVLEASVDQSLLNPSGDNTLTLYQHDTGGFSGQWLDQIEVDYLREPVAANGKLWLHNVSGGAQLVSGLASDDIIVIEAPTGNSVLRKDLHIESDGLGGFQVIFDATSDTDYLVVESSAVDNPIMELDVPGNLARNRNEANYLIIAPQEFIGTANALADYRAGTFGAVQVVLLQDIYQEFGVGREDPYVLAEFMQYVQGNWRVPPSMVVLIGKGTLDHKDRMGYGDSFMPTLMTTTPWSLAASDSRLLGPDSGRTMAIGRIPVTNDAEGLAYVEKVMAYENNLSSGGENQAVLVADNPDVAGDFHSNSDSLAQRLVDELGFDSVDKLYHPVDAPLRDTLAESAAWETGYVSYDGHGTTSQIGDFQENFLNAVDAQSLTNSQLPLFTALTCTSGDFSAPASRSLASALVLNPNGGAIASMAPTGLSLDLDAQTMGNSLVDYLFQSIQPLGEAVRLMKVDTTGETPQFMQRIYSVVGDPAVYAR